MTSFTYTALPARVLFGRGTVARLPEEAERLGLQRVMVLSTDGHREKASALARLLGSRCAGTFTQAVMHTPVEVTERALTAVQAVAADGIVATGGGSTIGLSKAIALRTDLPQVVLPTTYAGSEMTPILGETAGGVKQTQSTPKVLPEVVIYDVDATLSLSASQSGLSGMNAIAHAVEALYARDANPLIDAIALEGIRRLARALPALAHEPGKIDARTDALLGAWLCAICLGSVGMALHHKLCHTLGGTFGLPHAETHAVLLPYVARYNGAAAARALDQVAGVLGAPDAAAGLYALARSVGAPRGLKSLGMPADAIDHAAQLACANAYWNPRPLDRESIRALVAQAYEGGQP